MRCPKCMGANLKEGTVKDSSVKIDYCKKCKGIWFDRSEFEEVVDEAIKELSVPRDAKAKSLYCPKCVEPLHSCFYPQTLVEINMCKKCKGFWLDAGELKEIKKVRGSLEEPKEYGRVDGIKGALIDLIDSAIDSLMDY